MLCKVYFAQCNVGVPDTSDFDGHFSKANIFNPYNENQIDFYDQTIPVYAQAMLSLPAQQN